MEVSALKYQSGGIALHGRSPLLRLQSDERLITAIRRGNAAAFEVLVSRYQSRLHSFCRHMLGSREDAEDVLQEVYAAAFNAIVADERPINVRPWLYRIARNRSLNHMRRATAIGVDSMDHHIADHGVSTADKVHDREEFRMLVGDIQDLPETQRTALVLREMDALSYEQIAEAMETTVSSVKSLLVRARVGLAEASEARLLSCEEVRIQLAEVAEGLQKRASPLVRRHVKDCKRCSEFRGQLKATNKALAALLPVGPLVVLKRLAFLHLGHGAASAGAGASTAGAAGSTAGAGAATAGAAASAGAAGASAAGGAALAGTGAFSGGSLVTAGLGAVATKAAAGLAAAAVVTAGAVAVDHHPAVHRAAAPTPSASVPEQASTAAVAPASSYVEKPSTVAHHAKHPAAISDATTATTTAAQTTTPSVTTSTGTTVPVAATTTATTPATTSTPAPGRVQTQTDPTVLPPTTSTPAPPIGVPVSAPPVSTGTTIASTPVTTGTPATTGTPVTTGVPVVGATTPPPTSSTPGSVPSTPAAPDTPGTATTTTTVTTTTVVPTPTATSSVSTPTATSSALTEPTTTTVAP